MTKIRVPTSREYDVLIENSILDKTGELAAKSVGVCTAAVISDDNVFPLYGQKVIKSLESAGFKVKSFVFPHGEHSKNLETYGKVLNFLCSERLTRSDVLIALGGGVTGDLTGFAAATYQRGINFIQIPTTLLAMVDSSVGGKTAVDLDGGKNQVGCFYQPSLVICDPQTLDTLPEEEYRCGCAEVIKYAVLNDSDFFASLCQVPVKEQLEQVISTCVKMKRDIVQSDEFDRGCRQLLNLGHTIGHAVEKCSEFSVLHGQAVAIGMAMICKAAAKMGICSIDVYDAVVDILEKYALPVKTEYSADMLFEAAMADKKISGSKINLIVPEKIGRCRTQSIAADAVKDWIIAGGN